MSKVGKCFTSRNLIEKVLRVDHSGELGAYRIYQGQMEAFQSCPWLKNDQKLMQTIS
ncbi:MAG: Ubiquinone biosynthesis protein coq7, partial [Paramarteilia canceri]